MSDSDEEYAFYGTPLEPIEEGDVPRKRPLKLEEQEVTDKHGRRRFHGAFTGGFSAGFYNSVGSLEGWKPSNFKSTRSERSQVKIQQPLDFMDEEDTEEFGIAQRVLKAKPEYEKVTERKRKGQRFHEGPIPGDPVLQSILRPARETIGVLLLMKMGWKPGQGIGPKLTKLEKKLAKKKVKVYGCLLGPGGGDESDSSEGESDLDPRTLLAPLDVEAFTLTPKEDSAGLGYSGLQRGSVLGPQPKVNAPFRLTDRNNKKLSIMGQAFGVGAFEEEDEDIYSVDDMSNYDFSLGGKEEKKGRPQNQLALTDGGSYLFGFIGGKLVERKKYFPPPEIPPGFQPVHVVKKTRFDSAPPAVSGKAPQERLDSNSRAAMIGEPSTSVRIKQELMEVTEQETPAAGWQPFSSDPAKQERYNKFLQLVKIGAKDAVKTIQPFTMTDWERERELKEFEEVASRLNTLSGFLGERFTHGGDRVKEESTPAVQAAQNKMYGKLTRTSEVWIPDPLICKRFNIKPPNSSGELEEVARKTKSKPRFSVFDFLEASKNNQLSLLVEEGITAVKEEPRDDPLEESQSTPNTPPEATPRAITPEVSKEFEDPPDKMDLFKAIFESSGESEAEADERPPTPPPPRLTEAPASLSNVLRNTSPPRGIFANIDEVIQPKPKEEEVVNKAPSPTPPPPDAYGPMLPSAPAFVKPSARINLELNVDDGQWVEKGATDSPPKSHKKHKKDKKKKHKHKKKKKKSKYSDSD